MIVLLLPTFHLILEICLIQKKPLLNSMNEYGKIDKSKADHQLNIQLFILIITTQRNLVRRANQL